MQIQLLSLNQSNNTASFKSVYPVYHWCKVNGKYRPVSDGKNVGNCQRLLTGMLNSKNLSSNKVGKTFIQQVANYIAENDADYRSIPYVRSFYNVKGGIRYDSKGKGYKIEPVVYILSGNDAIEFEKLYGKPLRSIAKNPTYTENELHSLKKQVRMAYHVKGIEDIKQMSENFKDKTSLKPLELHTIFVNTNCSLPPRLIKLEFFQKGDENNPLITNGIICS